MKNLASRLRYIAMLARFAVTASMQSRMSFWIFAVMMCANNIVYFALWAIYFHNYPTLRGWNVTDFAILQGIATMGFGLAFFFCGGAWNIARIIFSGGLDGYIGRPRSVLLPVLMSESRSSCIGDIAGAFILWLAFGGRSLADLPLLILLSVAAAAIFLGAMVILQSLAFWISGASAATYDSLYEIVLTLSVYPQHTFHQSVQFLIYSLLPVAYVGLMPVELMREFSWQSLAVILAAAPAYLWLAAHIFNRGLKSYTSGNAFQR